LLPSNAVVFTGTSGGIVGDSFTRKETASLTETPQFGLEPDCKGISDFYSIPDQQNETDTVWLPTLDAFRTFAAMCSPSVFAANAGNLNVRSLLAIRAAL
jgi:hypothetical protein